MKKSKSLDEPISEIDFLRSLESKFFKEGGYTPADIHQIIIERIELLEGGAK